MKARPKLKSGVLAVGYPSHRDEKVLDCSGNRTESILWDVAVDGGLVSTISFVRKIPANAIVTNLLVDEIVPVVGATSVTLRAGTTALSAALDLTASSGVTAPALVGSAAGIKLAIDSELNIVIATTPASAGQVRIYVSYKLPNDR